MISLSDEEYIKKLEEENHFFLEFKKAEKDGFDAYTAGVSIDNCPLENEDLKIAWTSGWTQHELFVESKRTVAVLVWSVEALQMIEQLARGQGQSEIADKLRYVSDKISGADL